jgi:hypothetical protein
MYSQSAPSVVSPSKHDSAILAKISVSGFVRPLPISGNRTPIVKRIFFIAVLAGAAIAHAQTFVRAQFIFFRDKDGKSYSPPKQLTITDQDELAKLTRLIPGVGLNKGGLKPGGWDGWGTIRLVRKNGAGIQVFFPADGKRFSMVGIQGDFPAVKGFAAFLADVEKRAKQ